MIFKVLLNFFIFMNKLVKFIFKDDLFYYFKNHYIIIFFFILIRFIQYYRYLYFL